MKKYNHFYFKNRSYPERFLLLVLFIISSLLIGNESQFISIQTDQTGQSQFLIDINSPGYFPDIKIGSIRYDGAINLPIGIYKITEFPHSSNSDTNEVRNFFNWKQGDFEYREISIGAKSASIDSGRIRFSGFGRSFPGNDGRLGPPGSDYKGNVLQNYLLEYEKEYRNGEFTSGFAYHKENVGLPTVGSSNGFRNTESFHLSTDYNVKLKKMNIVSSSAFQIGTFDREGHTAEYLVKWLDVSGDYELNDNNWFIIQYSGKKLSVESKELLQDISSIAINHTKLNYFYHKPTFGISVSIDALGSTVFPGIEISKNLFDFQFSIKRSIANEMNTTDSLKFTNVSVINNNVSVKYNSDRFLHFNTKITGMYLEWDKYQFPGISGQFQISQPWISLSGEGVYYNSQDILVSRYGHLSANLHPVLWWTDRYRFSAGIEGIYYHLPGTFTLDLNSITGVTNEIANPANVGFINWKFGLKVKNFSLTYYTSFLSNQEINISPAIIPIEPFSYLAVDWRFIN